MSISPVFRAALLGLAVAASSNPAAAATCVGSCGHDFADGDVSAAPVGDGTFGWVSTAGGIDGAGQLAGIGGTNGSTFTTSFVAAAGDQLRYVFNFVSSDGQSAPGEFIYEDYASVQLLDAATDALVAVLFNARTEPSGPIAPGDGLPPIDPGVTLNPASVGITLGSGANGGPVWAPLGGSSGTCWGPGCGLTGWVESTYTIAAGGSYKLQFAVTNWGDTAYDTGLAYAGLTVGGTPIVDFVPEPETWALMIAGFGMVGAAQRRRRPAAVLA